MQQDNAASGSREGEKKGGGGGEVVRIDLFAAGTELVCGRADIACVMCAQCRRESVHVAVSVCVWLRFGRNDKKKSKRGAWSSVWSRCKCTRKKIWIEKDVVKTRNCT